MASQSVVHNEKMFGFFKSLLPFSYQAWVDFGSRPTHLDSEGVLLAVSQVGDDDPGSVRWGAAHVLHTRVVGFTDVGPGDPVLGDLVIVALGCGEAQVNCARERVRGASFKVVRLVGVVEAEVARLREEPGKVL